MEHAAEAVKAADPVRRRPLGWRPGGRWALLERAVRTVLVVMADAGAHNLLQVAPTKDQGPVEAFASQASDPALGVRPRPWRPHRCANHADASEAKTSLAHPHAACAATADAPSYQLAATRPCHFRADEVAAVRVNA
jgi:hypothetical protein